MEQNTLHIISSSVPHPPDFGGAMDVFYKLKALHASGLKIILHCFEYSRPQSEELTNYCEEVHYYQRKTGLKSLLSCIPYIVKSRFSPELLERIAKDKYPILFEGLHTIAYLKHPELKERKQWVRAHNIEHDYYYSLSRTEKKLYKKLYFKIEAWKLKKYSSRLAIADGIFAISPSDAVELKKTNENTVLIPAFHGYSQISSLLGNGEYILYHGDLSVAENNHSAEFVIDLCKELSYKVIIAGKMPHNQLINLANQHSNVELIANPDARKMEQLVQNAGVILLPATQTTGLRLKLLVSLFMGRHCIASPEMVKGTCLEKLCHIAADQEEWRQAINLCMNTPFTEYHIQPRLEPLKKFLDTSNAQEIVKRIFI